MRVPDANERAELDIIRDINETITRNIERNKNLSADRRERIKSLMDRGWSMYGIAHNTGVTPNTVKRIIEERGNRPKTLMEVFSEADGEG
jgi:DNA-binding NarL/FixJ family response regulator